MILQIFFLISSDAKLVKTHIKYQVCYQGQVVTDVDLDYHTICYHSHTRLPGSYQYHTGTGTSTIPGIP